MPYISSNSAIRPATRHFLMSAHLEWICVLEMDCIPISMPERADTPRLSKGVKQPAAGQEER